MPRLSRTEHRAHCKPWQLKTLKHRLNTRCGIGGDSQAAWALSIHYTVLNYIQMVMVVDNTTNVRYGKLATSPGAFRKSGRKCPTRRRRAVQRRCDGGADAGYGGRHRAG